MFWLKLNKIFLILLSLEFSIPKKNKIFLVTSDKSNFFEKLINKKILIFNREKFNFYILICLLIKKKVLIKFYI